MRDLPLKLFIFLFCVSLFSVGAQNAGSQFKGDENFYFESAKDMLATGDLLTPRYMGRERFQKPVLFYWLIALSFKILGLSWYAARLSSIICGALCALLTFAISDLLFDDKRGAFFAALFAASTPLYYRYARLAVPDMALVFFITLALYFFLMFHKKGPGRGYVVLFFVACALAFLTKGPVGLIIPLFIAALFSLAAGKGAFFRSPAAIVAGIAVFALIVSPWFYFVYREHGSSYAAQVWAREILQRLGCGHAGPFITEWFRGLVFYASALVTRFFPYSLFMPFAFFASARSLSSAHSGEENASRKDARLFLVLWSAAVFFFFTFVAERRTHYLLALAPAVSALISENLLARFKKGSLLPAGIVSALALTYIAAAVTAPLGLFANKMEYAANVIKTEYKKGDVIAIGSHGIIPEELQVFFDIPVANLKVRRAPDNTPEPESAGRLLAFFNSEERVFCVIKRKDYYAFFPQKIRESLYVLGSYYVWKRRVKFDGELRESLNIARRRSLRDIFQNEIYVISNRE